jgi:hypothetical protein
MVGFVRPGGSDSDPVLLITKMQSTPPPPLRVPRETGILSIHFFILFIATRSGRLHSKQRGCSVCIHC